MKRSIALVFAILLGFQAFAHTSVAISGIASVDLSSQLSLDEAVSAFQTKDPFCGLGWEVVIDEVGLGGTYLVNFFQTGSADWWLDWYGEGLYLSYHLFGAGALIDPFVRAGIGCAGRVLLAGEPGAAEPLAISIFPFVGAGADVRLGALNLGAAVDYLPRTSAIPATLIQAYPLGQFQTSVLAGFKLGGGRRR
jgi:hypothetical protein